MKAAQTMTRLERVARMLWEAREARFPERVRRAPDAMDRATGAWAYCERDAEAAIAAYEAVLAEEGMVIVPREVTPSMVAALDAGMNMNEVWRAMIAAWLAERG